MPEFRAGQIFPLRYKSREIQVIIIALNGLGTDKPSIGLGLRGMDRHIGIPRQTLSDRVSEIEGYSTYWENPVHGDTRIARNHVPEAMDLEAIAYCKKVMALLDLDSIEQAHDPEAYGSHRRQD